MSDRMSDPHAALDAARHPHVTEPRTAEGARGAGRGPFTGVVVTGAASGIGQATCMALAEAGRPVAAWDLNGDGAAATAERCAEAFGVPVHAAEVDVRDQGAIADATAATVAALPSVGGLVHAAGVAIPTPAAGVDPDAWDEVLGVNVRAHALLVDALLPALGAAMPGSAIVGISSVEALIGHGVLAAYCASKAGLLGLTRSLAHALGGEGIRVNAVCPGAVDTPMLRPLIEQEGAREALERNIPLHRVADPADIARVVRFLLSSDAAYVHGTEIVVDGGMTAVRS
jgi:NAD(P)-dependent dehydrogenase (short-subunit alcohol dehydrogenase family)